MTSHAARWLACGSALVLAVVIFFIYYSSISTGFFADDYNFLVPAARLDLPDYLVRYFDPRLQTMWYRPLHGIQILIEWTLFGTNATGYHIANILFHAVNCWLLFAIVWRVSKKWHIGFASAFFYATFPAYALAVNWINITDPLAANFYLTGIWLWWSYLHDSKRRDFILTLIAFVIGLLIKQMVITLPVLLVLMDYLLVETVVIPDAVKRFRNLQSAIRNLLFRYWAFVLIGGAFGAAQYLTRSTHTFVNVFGYSLGPQIASILIQYLSLLVFPWGYFLPTDTQVTEGLPFSDERNLAWLAAAILLYLFIAARTRSRGLVFLGLTLLATLLPVLPFPFIELRYLYLPAMVSGVILALLLDLALTVLKRPRLIGVLTGAAFALIAMGSYYSIANANAGIFEIARQRRVPFRDISRAHPTFPDDTRLYFIDSISPVPELVGMFTLRYGRGVTVSGNDFWRDPVANLREHKNAFVYYFDQTGKPIEVPVEPTIDARPSHQPPLDFTAPIRLEGYELPRATIKRGDALVVLLYWRATQKVGKDYTVFVHLVDKNGQMLAGNDSPPHKGDTPISQWLAGQWVVDPIVMPIPVDARVSNDYRLEIGLYEFPSLGRLAIVDARGQPVADTLVIAPLSVVEK